MKNWLIVAILVVLAAGAYFYFSGTRQAAPPAVVSSSLPDRQPQPEPVPEPSPEATAPEPEADDTEQVVLEAPPAPAVDEIPLPMLSDSDPVVLENLGEMLGEPAVIRYVVSDNVISRIVATVDTLGSRQIPGVVQAVNGPATHFAASPLEQPEQIIRNEEGDEIPQFIINPANYERYTPYAELFEAVDASDWVRAYRDYYPLFLEAYRQMGYSEGSFNDRLMVIIDELLATPVVSNPLELMKPEAYYLFTDEKLEALTAGQKIMLRMGNENAERVKSKLREIRALL
jgi:hypothetical protein